MLELIGQLLVYTGLASLFMNELTVAVRRAIKPWWRDDHNQLRDAFMRDVHRHIVWLSSVLSIEIGLAISSLAIFSVDVRLLIYACCLAELVYRRRSFWMKVCYHNEHADYWAVVGVKEQS